MLNFIIPFIFKGMLHVLQLQFSYYSPFLPNPFSFTADLPSYGYQWVSIVFVSVVLWVCLSVHSSSIDQSTQSDSAHPAESSQVGHCGHSYDLTQLSQLASSEHSESSRVRRVPSPIQCTFNQS